MKKKTGFTPGSPTKRHFGGVVNNILERISGAVKDGVSIFKTPKVTTERQRFF